MHRLVLENRSKRDGTSTKEKTIPLAEIVNMQTQFTIYIGKNASVVRHYGTCMHRGLGTGDWRGKERKERRLFIPIVYIYSWRSFLNMYKVENSKGRMCIISQKFKHEFLLIIFYII